MDEWDDVRRVAPAGEPAHEAITEARSRLLAEIAATPVVVGAPNTNPDASTAAPKTRRTGRSPLGGPGRRRLPALAAVALSFALVAGVVGVVAVTTIGGSVDQMAPAATPSPTVEPGFDPGNLLCGAVIMPAAAVSDPEYLSLDDPDDVAVVKTAKTAIDSAMFGMGAEMFVDPEEWSVVRRTETQLALMRPIEMDDEAVEYARRAEGLWVDHEIVELRRSGTAWTFSNSGSCELRVQLDDGLQNAGIALNPAHPLDPASDVIHLLVQDWACTSGRGAEGRIAMVRLEQREASVGLLIGLTPLDVGVGTCIGTVPVAIEVPLDAPLGDRTILDLAAAPPRELVEVGPVAK